MKKCARITYLASVSQECSALININVFNSKAICEIESVFVPFFQNLVFYFFPKFLKPYEIINEICN